MQFFCSHHFDSKKKNLEKLLIFLNWGLFLDFFFLFLMCIQQGVKLEKYKILTFSA